MDITFDHGNNSWKFHDDTMMGTRWKRCDRQTDGQTDGRTDRRTENTICRAAWSQLKTNENDNVFVRYLQWKCQKYAMTSTPTTHPTTPPPPPPHTPAPTPHPRPTPPPPPHTPAPTPRPVVVLTGQSNTTMNWTSYFSHKRSLSAFTHYGEIDWTSFSAMPAKFQSDTMLWFLVLHLHPKDAGFTALSLTHCPR